MRPALTSLFLCVVVAVAKAAFEQAESCKVFCSGELLDSVQQAHLFEDSKEFVDMPLRLSPDETLRAFEALENKTDPEVLRDFVQSHFSQPGTELEFCRPDDFVSRPSNFDRIRDPLYRQWAYEIHQKWKILCRKVKEEVQRNPNHYSLIPVPFPFIAPGGRFREFYYWDSFWIVKGLLASEMDATAKNMIRNLGEMVRRFGFVPNGGRVYYLHRSQPPLLPACVEAYFQATGDEAFLKEMLPLLEREQEFWERERTLLFKPIPYTHETYQLYRYKVNTDIPRPESYKEDMETASHAQSRETKREIWSEIAGAAESGWDFSSRWFGRDGVFNGTIRSVRTSKVLPVDLNAFICGNQRILADLYDSLGNATRSKFHRAEFETMKYAMERIFWDPDQGSWMDVDLDLNARIHHYYVSTATPLFTGCAHNAKDVGRRVLSYLESAGALDFPGGLPTSLQWSGEQWDSPNGWAPTNHIIIDGLRRQAEQQPDPIVADAAFQLANRWIQTNYFVYTRSSKMFEKYDVESEFSAAGSGGEYEVQEGFGWSNGVILDLLLTYGDRLRAPVSHSFFAAKRPS